MPRPIYVLLIDCFIVLSFTYTFLLEHVKSRKNNTVVFYKEFPEIGHKTKIHVKNRKKYLFLFRNSYTQIKNISQKFFIVKHHKVNYLPHEIKSHTIPLLNSNNASFLKGSKFKIFNNDNGKNNFSKDPNEETDHGNNDRIIDEKNEKWKKYFERKRKKEILKDLNSNLRKKGKRDISHSFRNGNDSLSMDSTSESNTMESENIIQNDDKGKGQQQHGDGNDQNGDDENGEGSDDDEEEQEEDDDDEGEEDDDSYDAYDSYNPYDPYENRNGDEKQGKDKYSHLDYAHNHEEGQGGNFFFMNNGKKENAHNRFYENRRNNGGPSTPPSINDSINNIFTSKESKDFPLFFPLNNKSFENSNNKYFDKICSIPPNELINRFFENTSERVKEAVKNIIFNIIGNIQKYTIETSILITHEKIYNFLLQIILTGYMIKNADYRLSLNESLYDQNNIINKKEDDFFNLKKSFYSLFADKHKKSGEETLNSCELNNQNNCNPHILNQNKADKQKNYDLEKLLTSKNLQDDNSNYSSYQNGDQYNHDDNQIQPESTSYAKCKNHASDNFPIINTKNYIIFLRKKIMSLENQIKMLKENKSILNDDLLSYIKSLTDIQLRSLTDNIGALVLDATKKIVELVIQGMTLNINKNLSNELIYISGSVLTYICFWQLIIGYTLREMEIRDELSDYLKGS
ncbi:hypothetical protein, conserved [Plasmodium gonderi]|uniref:Uncharacterized protein n=1 Tax=Plasmodium gonderi TaxID=77519 RepID=A0A1Y1JGB5_PLAGO|nr:hypothetical protein, conserved [Plasmodium gonderi]GAW81290.1 hypothetical protein, conserved [Plasmodium gonderi]